MKRNFLLYISTICFLAFCSIISFQPKIATASTNHWDGHYYNGTELSGKGTPESIQNLKFDWGYKSPISGVQKDEFSARFSKKISGEQEYFVQAYADDGIRVKVGDQTLVNRWSGSAGEYDEGFVTGLSSEEQRVEVEYFERRGQAVLFAEVVPLGDWNAYYYANQNLAGTPVNTRVVKAQKDGSLHENHGRKSPIAGVPKDRFSARYTTAKRIKAGEYVLRTRADDGVRVYVDGKLVLDRWTASAFQEDAVKVEIKNRNNTKSGEEDIHWVVVEHLENTGESKIDFSIQPLEIEIPTDGWLGSYFKNNKLTGNPVVEGGTGAKHTVLQLKYNWGRGAPHKKIPQDEFTARFSKKILGKQDYFVQTYADDGIRVKVGDKTPINRWSGSAGEYDKGIVTGLPAGNQLVHTEYYERRGQAVLFAEVLPLGDWNAYYYANQNLAGTPVNTRVVKAQKDGSLHEDHGRTSPIAGVPKDRFSARYTTAKRIKAGEYIVRTRADDGVRVYVDGELVLDRWTASAFQEDAVKVEIKNRKNTKSGEEDIHWIVVEHLENTGASKIDFSIQPLENEIPTDGWLGSYFKNNKLTGNPVVEGGAGSKNSILQLKYNWGRSAPHKKIPQDEFTARFSKKVQGKQDYFVQTYADDGIRVKVGDKTPINRWSGSAGEYDEGIVTGLPAGEQLVHAEYYERRGQAVLFAEIVPLGDWNAYYYANQNLAGTPVNTRVVKAQKDGSLQENHGRTSPVAGVPKDRFSTRYTTAKRIKAGEYVVRTRADDGVRVYVDGELVLDRWTSGAFQEDAVKVEIKNRKNTKSGEEDIHWVVVEHLENTGESKIDFSIQPLENEIPIDGWYSEYYNNKELKGLSTVIGGANSINKFEEINFDWGYESPHKNVNKDNFSARYIRNQKLPEGDYILNSYADDGIRVYIDDELVIDRWYETTEREDTVKIHIQDRTDAKDAEREIHRIKVEYYENRGKSSVKFSLQPVKDELLLDEWLGLFYSNMNLKGNALVVGGQNSSTQLKNINFNWGLNSPIQGIPIDEFSASFYKKVDGNQDYFVSTFADDGVRVKVGGQTAINRWSGSAGTYDRGLVTNLPNGEHVAQVDYYDRINEATVYAEVLPLGDWMAYYYPNKELQGHPTNARTLKSNAEGLLYEDHGPDSPITGIPKDHFSTKYISAKQLTAGDYIIRAAADDGVRVYVDGELVLDRWTDSRYREDAVKVQIKDQKDTKDIHWIEVHYYENTGSSKINLTIEPYDKKNLVSDDSWYVEYFNNRELEGPPAAIEGGKKSLNRITELDFNWKLGSPHQNIQVDRFSARYEKTMSIPSAQLYRIEARADNGVRVIVNGKVVIDAWNSGIHNIEEIIELNKGNNHVVVEYFENTVDAYLKVELNEVNQEEIFNITNYNYSFSSMVDKQMAGTPKSDGAGNIPATRQEVEYYSNPSNFDRGTKEYYQFLVLSKPAGLNAKEINDKILFNKGILKGTAQAFIDAGKKYNINDAYLIAHTLHETGNGTSTLAKGIPVDRNGKVTRDSKGNLVTNSNTAHTVYNMYGYGAHDNCPIDCGAEYAFKQRWFSPETAIIGGAGSVNSYIARGQDTLYKMRWNPVSPGYPQYATHVAWATIQTNRIYEIYRLVDNYVLFFDEPQFINQPPKTSKPSNPGTGTTPTPTPPSNYPSGVYGVTNTGGSNLNLRDAPNTNSTTKIIASIPNGSQLEVIGTSGSWKNVKYNGTTGWVSGDFVDLMNLLEVTVSGLNVRSGAASSNASLGTVNTGELLTAVLVNNNIHTIEAGGHLWYEVMYNDKKAWISGGKNGTEYINVK